MQKLSFPRTLLLILLVSVFWVLFRILFVHPYSEVALVAGTFAYQFNEEKVIQEAGEMAESKDPYWWVNSGGVLVMSSTTGSTHQGELSLSKWRILYRISNPTDTDNGTHPQNIFRLVSRNTWQDVRESAYFKIIKDNLSESPNRNQSNGVLLFSRYQDGNNLYYAGLRVDGTAVIKKKVGGEYTTLAQRKIFGTVNNNTYDRVTSPSFLPHNVWLGLETHTYNVPGGVAIELSIDTENTGRFLPVLQAFDPADELNGSLQGKGSVGIRTDFMDVEFRDFLVTEDTNN